MLCKIDDRQVPCGWLYFREFDYGRGHSSWPAVRYAISVDAGTFSDRLASFYEDYANDDNAHGELEDDGTILRLRALGWPRLTELIRLEPPLMEVFILKHIDYSVLQCLFPSGYKERPRYLIDSVEQARIVDQDIILSGRALVVPSI
jgi:hypothetical protein